MPLCQVVGWLRIFFFKQTLFDWVASCTKGTFVPEFARIWPFAMSFIKVQVYTFLYPAVDGGTTLVVCLMKEGEKGLPIS